MVGCSGKSWKFVNSRNKVFLKDIEEQQNEKIKQRKKYFVYIMGPGKKLSEAWKSPGNWFLKKGNLVYMLQTL